MIVDGVIEDFGSGLNYNRKKWNNLLKECMENKVLLLHVFSSKIHGLRKYKSKIKGDKNITKSIQD